MEAQRIHVAPGTQMHNTDSIAAVEWCIQDPTGRVRRFFASCWCQPVFESQPRGTVIIHRDNALGDVREI